MPVPRDRMGRFVPLDPTQRKRLVLDVPRKRQDAEEPEEGHHQTLKRLYGGGEKS